MAESKAKKHADGVDIYIHLQEHFVFESMGEWSTLGSWTLVGLSKGLLYMDYHLISIDYHLISYLICEILEKDFVICILETEQTSI